MSPSSPLRWKSFCVCIVGGRALTLALAERLEETSEESEQRHDADRHHAERTINTVRARGRLTTVCTQPTCSWCLPSVWITRSERSFKRPSVSCSALDIYLSNQIQVHLEAFIVLIRTFFFYLTRFSKELKRKSGSW